MAPTSKEATRGGFSSFWVQEVAGPARETYLKMLAWKNQAIGYLGLGKESMALRRGALEHQPTVKTGISRREFLRLVTILGGSYAAAEALSTISWLSQFGTTAGAPLIPFVGGNPDLARAVNPGVDTPSPDTSPSSTATVTQPATGTKTATQTQASTETATEAATVDPTAGPTATERVLDVEHGELPPFSSRDISWEQSMQQLNEHIRHNSGSLQAFEWKRSMYPTKETAYTTERDGRKLERPEVVFRDLTYLGYLDFYFLEDRYFDEKVLLFGYRGPGGQQTILPFITLEYRSYEIGSVYVDQGNSGGWYKSMTADEFTKIVQPGKRSDVFAALSFPESSAATYVIDRYSINVYTDVAPLGIAKGINLGNTCWGCPS